MFNPCMASSKVGGQHEYFKSDSGVVVGVFSSLAGTVVKSLSDEVIFQSGMYAAVQVWLSDNGFTTPEPNGRVLHMAARFPLPTPSK